MGVYSLQEMITTRKNNWEKKHNLNRDKEYVEASANYLCSGKVPESVLELREHPEYFIELFLYIVDKDRKLTPFILNTAQRHFINKLNETIRLKKENKIHNIIFLVLKGRQMGFTSLITGYQLACTVLKKNFAGFTIADCSDNVRTIFEDKAKYPYSLLPPVLKPEEKFNNTKELYFNGLNSSWRIASASKDIGRSKTINFLHCSESAFFDVPISAIQAAIGNSITSESIVVYESTANGFNEFKDLWDSKTCTNLFYEWWLSDEYSTNFLSEEDKLEFVEKIEKETDEWIINRCNYLLKKKLLRLEQVYWYYRKWESLLDKDTIKQEFPVNSDECFLASGRCVFDQEKIIQRKEYLVADVENKLKQGFFNFKWNNEEYRDKIIDTSISYIESPLGYIKIFKEPVKEHFYVIGGDTKGEGSDKFAATIIDNITGERVAWFHGNVDPDYYVNQLYCLGVYYNTALISVEINFDIYPVKELQRLLYPHQYQRQSFDTSTNQYQRKYGWKTDGSTRPMIISNQITLIREHIEFFNSIEMLDECLTFVYDKDGRPDAQSSKHDDLLFSDMIAEATRPQQKSVVDITKKIEGFYTEGELEDMGIKINKIVRAR